jgi:hypothetical protein
MPYPRSPNTEQETISLLPWRALLIDAVRDGGESSVIGIPAPRNTVAGSMHALPSMPIRDRSAAMAGREARRENRGIGLALPAGSRPFADASHRPVMVVLAVVSMLLASGRHAAASESIHLAVPYITQAKWLCGGAAAAMVFRYWGDGKADPNQFAPLLDRAAGGIATDVLAHAIEERGWRVVRFVGSVESVEELLRDRRPVIVLLGEARGRFHYVVVVGTTDGHVVVHDPARGPSRRLSVRTFVARWQAAGFWALLVLPPVRGNPPDEFFWPKDECVSKGAQRPEVVDVTPQTSNSAVFCECSD